MQRTGKIIMPTVFFVTALIVLNVQPSLGWIQYTYPYDDIKLCQKYIRYQKDSILLSIGKQFGSKLVSVETFECMTRKEAVKRNTELGH